MAGLTVVLTAALLLIVVTQPRPLLALLMVVWGASYPALPVARQTEVLRVSDHGVGEATTSIYVLVFNGSIAAGVLVGGFGIDTGGPTVPVLIGALFSAVSIVAISFIRETAA